MNCFLNGSVKKNAVFFLVIKHKLILRVLNNIDWGDGFIQLLPLRTGSYSDWFSVGARCRCVHLTAVVRNFITDIYQNHTREPYTERFTHVCVVGTPDDGGWGPYQSTGDALYPGLWCLGFYHRLKFIMKWMIKNINQTNTKRGKNEYL